MGETRKTIGEEGSRKQTATVFLLLLGLGILLYLPSQSLRINLPKLTGSGNQGGIITITNPNPAGKLSGREAVKVKPDLESLISAHPGRFGVVVKSLRGEEIEINPEMVMTAASVIKLPVLVVYYQSVDNGSLNPEEIYILAEADRWEYGTGSLQYQPAGKEYTYKEIARLVANQSDNMGAEILIKKLGGYAKVQQAVGRLGMAKTNLRENEISAADAAGLFFQLAQGKLLKSPSLEELFNNLTKTVNEDRIPKAVPSGVRVVHKFGSETGVVNDCGLVEASNPYVICVLSIDVNVGEAETILPKISEAVWNWLGD